jgi:hypothetical protein
LTLGDQTATLLRSLVAVLTWYVLGGERVHVDEEEHPKHSSLLSKSGVPHESC